MLDVHSVSLIPPLGYAILDAMLADAMLGVACGIESPLKIDVGLCRFAAWTWRIRCAVGFPGLTAGFEVRIQSVWAV